MESIRMLDESDWPDLTTLADYQQIYEPDPNFYHPVDHIGQLGVFLRDHTIRKRKEREEQKKQAEANRIRQEMMY